MMSNSKYLQFVGLGVILWFAFVIFIRLLGADVFTVGNPVLLLLFAASMPLLWASIIALAALTSTPVREMFVPVVIMTSTALLCDGLAVGFTSIYGPTDDQVRAAASYILFGAGAGQFLAQWLAERAKASQPDSNRVTMGRGVDAA